jgi:O-antigen/teichoic acid export membrane protein
MTQLETQPEDSRQQLSEELLQETEAAQTPPEFSGVPGPTTSLRRRALTGSAWTLAHYGGTRVLQLASNLILTRMLVPDLFGLMAVVNLWMMALQMFSDIGIGPSIIQDKRADEHHFLNTAWTIQVIRGASLWMASCVLAVPVAAAYDQPILLQVIPIVGLTSLILGFNPTSYFSLHRHLLLGRITVYEIIAQVVCVVAMVAWASIWPNIWALVVGQVARAIVILVLGWFALPGFKNRFEWDRLAARSLIRFGRWIFISTVITFLVMRIDQFTLSGLMGMALFGVFWIAMQLSDALAQFLLGFGSRLLLPLYARLKDEGDESLRRNVTRVRLLLLGLALPPTVLVIAYGEWIVKFLYPPEFEAAGWMLKVLSVGAIGSIVSHSCLPVLLAVGDSFRHLMTFVGQLIILAIAIAVGAYLGGAEGVIFAVAYARLLGYFVTAAAIRKYGVWTPWIDLGPILGALIGLTIALMR